ncbi:MULTISPECIES: MerR family transcriptional regulator [unclassified Bacillus (in: firmicutes)]|uniref:MerR family transcriptional regulator n=1 Tax=unclassified Bacillus (in: firmicutes) TaxID=185979 RepID=UPI0008F3C22D|nr:MULTISPECIES: MerR family transcriptional regulator [unclassified Bacillus (in: firmicutes)]SFA87352.1 MerR HTH family regulatory protein [Bacillus sp. UNCCL13]SFQ84193.1 MerR HTH family regulatory protein [Bacillus sp. cl95]
MKTESFMLTYTIQEVSKRIKVPDGTIRQWEKDLKGVLHIPRTKQGTRYYTEVEIHLLEAIKQMREKNLGKTMIRELIQKHLEQGSQATSESFGTSLSVIPQEKAVEATPAKNVLSAEELTEMMEIFTQKLVATMSQEMRTILRKEITEEVKKEISKGSLNTVKYLSDSLYKSSEKTKAEMRGFTNTVVKASERTSETLVTLANRVANSSKISSEQISLISQQVDLAAESTNTELKEMANYLSVKGQEVNVLAETLHKDREFYLETINQEREAHRKEILQREKAFQDLVANFREAAAAKKSKGWKFWS